MMRKLIFLASFTAFSTVSTAGEVPFDVSAIKKMCSDIKVVVSTTTDTSLLGKELPQWTDLAKRVCNLPLKYPTAFKTSCDGECAKQKDKMKIEFQKLVVSKDTYNKTRVQGKNIFTVDAIYPSMKPKYLFGKDTYIISFIRSSFVSDKQNLSSVEDFLRNIFRASSTQMTEIIRSWNNSRSF